MIVEYSFFDLSLAGVLDRFFDLQIILRHWGEVVLFYSERLKAGPVKSVSRR
jgi:uncharacterized protein